MKSQKESGMDSDFLCVVTTTRVEIEWESKIVLAQIMVD